MDDKKDRKDALHHAFQAVHHRAPTPAESERINKAVDNRGTPGRPKKEK